MAITEQIRVKPIGASTSQAEAALEREAQSLRDEIASLRDGDPFDRVDPLWKLGRLYETNLQDERALTAYREAADLLRQLGEDVALGQLFHTMGIIEDRLGRDRNAHKFLTQAQDLFESSGENDLLAIVHLDRGVVASRAGHIPAAQSAFTAAAACYAEAGSLLGQAHSHFFLGELNAATNPDRARWNLDRARMFYLQAADAQPKDGTIRIATPLAPASVDDPRKVAADAMAVFCERRCNQVQAEAAKKTEPEPPAGPAQVSTGKELTRAVGVLAVVSAIGVAVPILWMLLELPIVAPQIFHLAIAAAAALSGFVGLLFIGVENRTVQFLSPLLACVLVHQVNSQGILTTALGLNALATSSARAQDGQPPPATSDTAAAEPVSAPAPGSDAEEMRDALVDTATAHAIANDQVARAAALTAIIALDEQLGDGDLQRQHLTELVEAESLANRPEAELAALRALAQVEIQQGRTTSTVATFERIAEVANRNDDRADEAAAYVAVAQAAWKSNHHDKAVEALARAESVYRSLGDEAGLGDVDMERARFHADQDTAQAAQSVERALVHYRAARRPTKIADALIEFGKIDVKRGQQTVAERHFQEAVKICREAIGSGCEGRALIALSMISGSDRRATLRQATAAAKEAGNARDVVDAFVSLAREEGVRGDAEKALQAHTEAFVACDEIDDPLERAEAFLRVGKRAEEIVAPERAREPYSEALRTYESIRNRPGQIAALRELQRLSQGSESALVERYAKQISRIEEEMKQQPEPAAL